jgi:hypothetical protein
MDLNAIGTQLNGLSLNDLYSHALRVREEAIKLRSELIKFGDRAAIGLANSMVEFLWHLAKPLDLQSEEELRSWLNELAPLLGPAQEHLRQQSATELA